jgi:hypothetical protein
VPLWQESATKQHTLFSIQVPILEVEPHQAALPKTVLPTVSDAHCIRMLSLKNRKKPRVRGIWLELEIILTGTESF